MPTNTVKGWPLEGQRVVCAAVRDGAFHTVCSARHLDALMHQMIKAIPDWSKTYMEQGFIDQWGNFLSRSEAWEVAEKAGQIIRRVGGDDHYGGRLFSENLY